MSDMSDLPVTIYTPESPLSRPGTMLRDMFRDLLACRELTWRLAVRDISALYRQTYFGFLWALITPLSNTAVWLFLSSSGMITVSKTDLPYPVYVFTGTMLWGIFMDAFNAPLSGVQAARGMLSKINFPREAILISGIYQVLFNAVIKLVLILGVLGILGSSPGLYSFLIPVTLGSLILVGTALGLFITPVGLLYGDVGKGLPILMQLLMYITPVVFSLPEAGIARTLVTLNPLTTLIITAREWLTGQAATWIASFLFVNCMAFVLLLLGWVIYRLSMPILIERMSA